MIVRKLRLERGWSQEQLAQMCGVNTRTIQRIESGQIPGLESLKALAAVFEIDVSQLQSSLQQEEKPPMTATIDSTPQSPSQPPPSTQDARARRWQREKRKFAIHLVRYLMVVGFIFFVNLTTSPQYIWAWWPAFGWGLAIALNAVNTFIIEPLKEEDYR